MKYKIPSAAYKGIVKQLKLDSSFLKECNIIDYSLLIGIHDRGDSKVARMGVSDTAWKRTEQYNIIVSSDERYVVYFGIIDMLTDFNVKKKIEYAVKWCFIGKEISCVPPDDYAERFYDFMKDVVFSEDTSQANSHIKNSIGSIWNKIHSFSNQLKKGKKTYNSTIKGSR